jgi:coenzyme F420-reducing hydrogenase delta subunit
MGTALVVWRQHPINPRKRPKRIRTICEVLRELYREAEARGDALSMAKLDEANDMAKRMQKRIEELRPGDPYILSKRPQPQ